MRAMRVIVAVAFAFVVVGSLLLRAVAREREHSPIVSASNSAPEGILAFARLLTQHERQVSLRLRHDEVLPAFDVLFVPPPSAAAWTQREARELRARVEAGAHVVILCDDDPQRNLRMLTLTDETGVRCVDGEEISDARLRVATPDPGLSLTALGHRASGYLALDDRALAVVLAREHSGRDVVEGESEDVVEGEGSGEGAREAKVVAASAALGRGTVTTTLAAFLANDALAEVDNAAFALVLARGARVVIDEAHHVPRRQEVLRAAFAKPGPIAGGIALLLLLPFALLSLAPRAGDAPTRSARVRALTATDAALALATLYRRGGVVTDTPPPVSSEAP
jgi:hypothetical protein